jgi:multidrug transporter EmrE-like cation transporter
MLLPPGRNALGIQSHRFVGFFLYKEQLSLSKIAGVVICLVGLYFINK